MVSCVRCASDLWPFISTNDEIGALYLEYFTNNINGLSNKQRKEEKKKEKKVGDLSSLKHICINFFGSYFHR
jgi:hypothetical protein